MKEFTITVEERICKDFKVKANSIEEAMSIAEENYKNGEFSLDPGELQSTLAMAYAPETNESTEWKEF